MKIGSSWQRFWAFVDSGATYSIFKASEAEDLGFNYSKGQLIHAQVGDGGFIPVYLHKISLMLNETVFEATVGFSTKLGVEFNLLGRKDVFEMFDVTFSDSRKEILFQKV